MITRDDVVLALSNSGETAEVLTCCRTSARLGVPLIAMTGNADSDAGARRHACTSTSACAEEACPLNLAPTASTTATLAIGDALAVALLEARGFTAAGFRALASGRRARPPAAAARRRRDAHAATTCRGCAPTTPLAAGPGRDVDARASA